MKVDLHIHSTYSDGSLGPRKIVARVIERQLSVIAITDHDTVNHFPEMRELAGEGGPTALLAGTEFSSLFHDREIHILGYDLDPEDQELRRHLERVRLRREERAHRILERLERSNVRIPPSDLELIEEGATVGRVFIAQLLLGHGYVSSINEAFDRFLGAQGSAFVPYELTDARQVIAMIRQAGGISIFAHPNAQELESMGPALAAEGLEGAEGYRPGLGGPEGRAVRRLIEKQGLLVTGGSDWHSDNGRFPLGEFYLEIDRVREFLERIGVSVGH